MGLQCMVGFSHRVRGGLVRAGMLSWFLGDLAQNTEQVASEEFADALFGVASAEHRVGDHRQIPHVSHASRKRRTAVEIAAQSDVVFAHQIYGATYDANPLVYSQPYILR